MNICTTNRLNRLARTFGVLLIVAFMGHSIASAQATTVDLGVAGNFRILAGSAITVGTGSTVTGDIGLSPASGSFITGDGSVTGVKYSVDGAGAGTVSDAPTLTTAKNNLTAAYTDAANRTGTVVIGTELGTQNLSSGVYASGDGTFGLTGTLTLTGDANAVFIFKMSTTLTTAVASSVTLAGGAVWNNVYWQVGSSAVISGDFVGTIMADQAITLNSGAILEGRALARIAAVTFQGNNNALPVELISFTASVNNSIANLRWSTATEVNNFGFEIQRSAENNWVKAGFVEGNGTTNKSQNYSFTDNSLTSGKYSYRLKQIDRDGKFSYSQSVEVTIGQSVKEFALAQNYPNPFNPSTTINYQLPAASSVTLTVYDAIGKEVTTLVNEVKEAGSYSVQFNASHLSNGIYFYMIKAGNFTSTKKLALLK